MQLSYETYLMWVNIFGAWGSWRGELRNEYGTFCAAMQHTHKKTPPGGVGNERSENIDENMVTNDPFVFGLKSRIAVIGLRNPFLSSVQNSERYTTTTAAAPTTTMSK